MYDHMTVGESRERSVYPTHLSGLEAALSTFQLLGSRECSVYPTHLSGIEAALSASNCWKAESAASIPLIYLG